MNLYNLNTNLTDYNIKPFKGQNISQEESLNNHKLFFSFYQNRQLLPEKKSEKESSVEECSFKPKINQVSEYLAKDTYGKFGSLESKQREEYFQLKRKKNEEIREKQLKEKEENEIKQCTFKPAILKKNFNRSRNESFNASINRNTNKNDISPIKSKFNDTQEKIKQAKLNLTGKKNNEESVIKEIQRIRKARENKEKKIDGVINDNKKKQKKESNIDKINTPIKSPAAGAKAQTPVKSLNISELIKADKKDEKFSDDFIKGTKKNIIDNENCEKKSLYDKEFKLNKEDVKENTELNTEKIKEGATIECIKENNEEKINKNDNNEEEKIISIENCINDKTDKKNTEVESKSIDLKLNDLVLHNEKEAALETFILENHLSLDAAEKLRLIIKLK